MEQHANTPYACAKSQKQLPNTLIRKSEMLGHRSRSDRCVIVASHCTRDRRQHIIDVFVAVPRCDWRSSLSVLEATCALDIENTAGYDPNLSHHQQVPAQQTGLSENSARTLSAATTHIRHTVNVGAVDQQQVYHLPKPRRNVIVPHRFL